jgi:hypothetical protein
MSEVKRYHVADFGGRMIAAADGAYYHSDDYDTLATRLAEAELERDSLAGKLRTALLDKAESERRVAELEARQGEQKPIGYINKKDLARLTDEITWDGSYLTIGVDHFAQWLEDTPYDHLTPIYSAPPPAPEVAGLATAAKQVIEMNRQHAKDQYGDANKAESWSCVTVLRAALAAHEQQAGGNTDE